MRISLEWFSSGPHASLVWLAKIAISRVVNPMASASQALWRILRFFEGLYVDLRNFRIRIWH
jgi:hypothetical protein